MEVRLDDDDEKGKMGRGRWEEKDGRRKNGWWEKK